MCCASMVRRWESRWEPCLCCGARAARWPLQGAVVVHRVGLLQPGDPIVLVAVVSSHRHDAFEACAFLMDYLKTQAPLWKKESTSKGAQWVDARESDDAALARWGIEAGNSRAS